MTTISRRPPVQPGEPAPDFKLPSVHQDGEIALADYQGRSLFLAIFLGLWCPFCRRNLAHLGETRGKLIDRGIETLAVVATELDNARLYFKYRPARVPLVADPALVTHRAYGLPHPELDQSTMELLAATRINPTGELPAPVPATEIGAILDRVEGYQRGRSKPYEKALPISIDSGTSQYSRSFGFQSRSLSFCQPRLSLLRGLLSPSMKNRSGRTS